MSTDDEERRIGVVWLGPFEWLKLKKLAVDPERLEDTYEEWLSGATKTMAELAAKGIAVERVPVDVDELVDWCRAEGEPLDGKARAAFAAEKLRQKYEAVH